MQRVRPYSNERVDLVDFEAGAGGGLALAESLRAARAVDLPPGRTYGTTGTQARILRGFGLTVVGGMGVGNTASLAQGWGWLPYLDGATVQMSLLLGEVTPGTTLLDFSAAAAGDYAVYVRAVFADTATENRVFWDAAAAAEQLDAVATRQSMTWEAEFRAWTAAPPGSGEWVPLYKVTVGGGPIITAVADYRHLYYEGDAANAYAGEWGGGTTRNADRATYGVGDEHTWKQAVRVQLRDMLGVAWYASAPTSLQALKPIAGRLVTIDRPGGPGGDGTYASLVLAAAGLNAANGGTILLSAGIYSLTALVAFTKTVALVALEDGVVLQNNMGAAVVAALQFNAGSDGSRLVGVDMTEGGATNERQVLVAASRVRLEGCSITGRVQVAAAQSVRLVDCLLADAAAAAATTEALLVDGADTCVTLEGCRLTGAGATSIVRVATTTSAPGMDGTVAFRDCRLTQAGSWGVSCPTGQTVKFDACHWYCTDVVTDSYAIQSTAVGRLVINDCYIHLAACGGAWVNPIVYVNNHGVGGSARIDGLEIDFNNLVPAQLTNLDSPVVFRGGNIRAKHMHCTKIMLPNGFTRAGLFPHVMLDPTSAGGILIEDSFFDEIDTEALAPINGFVIGQDTAGAGTGRIELRNCRFDGTLATFAAVSEQKLVAITGGARAPRVTGCWFFGGIWKQMLHSMCGGVYTDNHFAITLAGSTEIAQIVGHGAGEREDAYLSWTDNHVYRCAVTAAQAVNLLTALRAVVADNTDQNTGAACANGSIQCSGIVSVVLHNNNCNDGITTPACGTVIPAVLATNNILV